jgi:hypothetical protein
VAQVAASREAPKLTVPLALALQSGGLFLLFPFLSIGSLM